MAVPHFRHNKMAFQFWKYIIVINYILFKPLAILVLKVDLKCWVHMSFGKIEIIRGQRKNNMITWELLSVLLCTNLNSKSRVESIRNTANATQEGTV